jgi:hypothetical protein
MPRMFGLARHARVLHKSNRIKLLQKKKLIFYRCLCNSNCNDSPGQSRSLYKYKLIKRIIYVCVFFFKKPFHTEHNGPVVA